MVILMYSSKSEIDVAAQLIISGGVVVFPTETVYGLGANALDPTAVERIFAVKGRPSDNPLIVHLAEASDVGKVASRIDSTAHRLLSEFAPGPLTVVLPARPDLPRTVTAGLDTVAVRIPSHPVAHMLLDRCSVPIAAPSANKSGEPSPTTVEMARRSLGEAPDAYLDGGPCDVGLESTVLEVLDNRIRILRPGAVTEADILALLPDATVQASSVPPGAIAGQGAPSPGLRHRHYQPKARVCLWETPNQLEAECLRHCGGECRVGIIAPASAVLPDELLSAALVHGRFSRLGGSGEHGSEAVVRNYRDLREYARQLYAWFSELDDAGVDIILAHLPSGSGIGVALRDRLSRASSQDG